MPSQSNSYYSYSVVGMHLYGISSIKIIIIIGRHTYGVRIFKTMTRGITGIGVFLHI